MKHLMTTKIITSFLVIAVALSVISMGTFAAFSDAETSTGNTFAAGTLDLDSNIDTISFTDVYPGWNDSKTIYVTNNGSLPADLSMTIKNVVNDDNGCADPEDDVDTTCNGDPDGELGANLSMTSPGPSTDTINNREDVALDLGSVPAGTTIGVPLSFTVGDVGNEIQGDSVVFDIEWTLEQQ